ncbi:alpha/beta fold hydrolase [Pedobacter rhodius]|uniref:Alpha/beta hydrolase n=1 Tax=Pedobacter rhodius TaxID=3004098 RepID=A0ABT4L2J5_9SPHI|nr:alpha/beta hydrolase [Pedobacter sp. SJ11]MCZ4225411.1 alpha/beta hydrolase [Pedobacter sp. SJ11]
MKYIKNLVSNILLMACLFAFPCKANPTPIVNAFKKTPGDNYANINGMKMYYFTAGKGTPLILLHGAFSTIEKDFGKLIPTLAKSHLVIGIELQGHGHTNNIARPFSYQNMAADVIALMNTLGIPKADFIGYSMGGGVALEIAISQPQLIGHLVLESVAYSPAGMNMQNPSNLKPKAQTDLNHSVWKENYLKVSPDTAGWTKLVSGIYSLMGNWKGFTSEQIKSIKAPALLIFGDSDMSKGEHQIEMFRLLGGGSSGDLYQTPNLRLAILPGTTHVSMVDQYQLLQPIIGDFLKTSL